MASKIHGVLMVAPAVPPGFTEDAYSDNPAMEILIQQSTPLFLLRGFAVVERALLNGAAKRADLLAESVGSKPDKAFAKANGMGERRCMLECV